MILCLMFCGLLIVQTGCITQKNNTDFGEAITVDYKMNVSTSIDNYMPTMSSVPGIPIEVDTKVNNYSNDLELRITSDKGQLLLWDNDGKIIHLENEYICPYEDTTVYWTPLTENEGLVEVATIRVGIYDLARDKITITYIGQISLVEGEGYKIDYDVELN